MLLEEVYKKIVLFLNKEKIDYFIIGGIASGILGTPRFTADVDIDIFLKKNEVSKFLNKAEDAGFEINKKECLTRILNTGTFQIKYSEYHIDFLIASIELEELTFKRKQKILLYGIEANFPTPEDLILLKIISGRGKDIIDTESIIIRNKNKLDKKYLEKWAMKLSDEAQDMRIYNELTRLLKSNK